MGDDTSPQVSHRQRQGARKLVKSSSGVMPAAVTSSTAQVEHHAQLAPVWEGLVRQLAHSDHDNSPTSPATALNDIVANGATQVSA